jgi:alpha-tubulin suppressor-like RCC1 family protein
MLVAMWRPRILMAVVLAIGLLALAPSAPAVADGNESPGPGPGLPVSYPTVSAGWRHTCVIRPEGAVQCWGRNHEGQLGIGNNESQGDVPGEVGKALPAVNLGTGRTATALATGSYNTCALLDNGQVKCWGRNDQGQLGLGNNTDRGGAGDQMGNTLPAVALGTGRTATAITMSPARGGNFEQVHACALLDNGKVKCWGTNSFGELGLGTGDWRGGNTDVLGNNLPAVNLGTGRTATAISAGQNTTCAILDNGQVKCWGRGEDGRLGIGATDNRGDAANEMGDALPAVALGAGRTATAITQGHGFACALLDNQQIKCWGRNDMGQLGNGDNDQRGGTGDAMGDTLPAVDLGAGRSGRAVSAGENHVCALLDGDQAKCWGRNSEGQLGAGNTAWRGGTDDLMGDSLPVVELPTMQAITAGGDSTCARLWNEETRCWGSGAEGALGLGDTATRGDDPDEMGDALPSVDLPPSQRRLREGPGPGRRAERRRPRSEREQHRRAR